MTITASSTCESLNPASLLQPLCLGRSSTNDSKHKVVQSENTTSKGCSSSCWAAVAARRLSFECHPIIHHPITLLQGKVDAKVLLHALDTSAFGFIRLQAHYHGVKQRLVGTPLSPRRNDAIQSQSVVHGTVNVMNIQGCTLGSHLAQKYGRFGPSLNPARFDDRLGQLDRFAGTVGWLT